MSLIPALKIGLWNGWIFMSVFIIQMMIMIFADKRFREKSHVPKDVKRKKFEKVVPIIANLTWLLTMIYSVFLPFQPNMVWLYIGLSLFIIGLILIATATSNFMTTPPDQLITKGLYHFSRHPMYLATFFICLGTGFATGSWLFILITIIMVLCFHKEALLEERYCLDQYGNDYLKYMNSVPRWFGSPKRID